MAIKATDVTGSAAAITQSIGSRTAREGFQNEHAIVSRFNNWQESATAQTWLKSMGYELNRITALEAAPITGSYKTDVQVRVTIATGKGHQQDLQNLQVKLVTNKSGSNQIDKRWVNSYQELWDIPTDITRLLKLFAGEIPRTESATKEPKPPKCSNSKSIRRCFSASLHHTKRHCSLSNYPPTLETPLDRRPQRLSR